MATFEDLSGSNSEVSKVSEKPDLEQSAEDTVAIAKEQTSLTLRVESQAEIDAQQLDIARERLADLGTAPKEGVVNGEVTDFKIEHASRKDLGESIAPAISSIRRVWDNNAIPRQIQQGYEERFKNLGSRVNQYQIAVEGLKPTGSQEDEQEFKQLDALMEEVKHEVEELKTSMLLERRKFNQATENRVRGADQALEATNHVLRTLTKIQEDIEAKSR